eukprot:CAMPEP_0170501378 /NCGR_PEP_ID=MMETSP0208-20121228/38068_1 /TAXON_ID=197538 /ORGANISM="Strombidium inclinatum, Strain S3" /LENGTH=176 /DNA_ID=CAMNT_0010779877 /DNA_START=236 /DNA_END=766 /DNA_ORIENTATION=+
MVAQLELLSPLVSSVNSLQLDVLKKVLGFHGSVNLFVADLLQLLFFQQLEFAELEVSLQLAHLILLAAKMVVFSLLVLILFEAHLGLADGLLNLPDSHFDLHFFLVVDGPLYLFLLLLGLLLLQMALFGLLVLELLELLLGLQVSLVGVEQLLLPQLVLLFGVEVQALFDDLLLEL